MSPFVVNPEAVHEFTAEAGRKKRIAAFVGMLKRGETIHPNGKAR